MTQTTERHQNPNRAMEISSLNIPKRFNLLSTAKEKREMPAIEVGRICLKQAGRETGKKCVIIDVMDKSFVMVTGPRKVTGVKRRRVNMNHITPLQDKIDIVRGASDEEITSMLQSAGKLDDMAQTAQSLAA